jgi:hypothetical protein
MAELFLLQGIAPDLAHVRSARVVFTASFLFFQQVLEYAGGSGGWEKCFNVSYPFLSNLQGSKAS